VPIVMFLLSISFGGALHDQDGTTDTEVIPLSLATESPLCLFGTDAASPADVDERLMAARVRLNRRLHCG